MISNATQRSIFRWIHIVFAIPIVGYIYSPFEKLPDYAAPTRYVFLPVMVLSGLWMWKGHALRRLVSKRSGRQSRREATSRKREKWCTQQVIWCQRARDNIALYFPR
jgi:hypothetical protein